jgi:hypothetical protein
MDERRAALLEDTRIFWQARTSRMLTQEDARQAVENMSGFIGTLLRWAAAETSGAENTDTAEAA